jgi:hypothetical protein
MTWDTSLSQSVLKSIRNEDMFRNNKSYKKA